jgi:hypothetical protein
MKTKDRIILTKEIILSNFLIILASAVWTIFEYHFSTTKFFKSQILGDFITSLIQIEGVLIATLLTIKALRLNNIDNIINSHIDILNNIFDAYKCQRYPITTKKINLFFQQMTNKYDNKFEGVDLETYNHHKSKASNLIKQLETLYKYRNDNISRTLYPIIYILINIITLIFSFIFLEKLKDTMLGEFILMTQALMSVWSIILSIIFIRQLFVSPFDSE